MSKTGEHKTKKESELNKNGKLVRQVENMLRKKNSEEIMSMSLDEIKRSLNSGKISVCVVGVGRIGLPTALSFANAGLHTIGIDTNTKLVDMINSGDHPLKDEPDFDKIFNIVTSNKTFYLTTDIAQAVPKSDVILLSLPTPMDKDHVPDYSALISVGRSLNKLLEHGSIIVVESTIEPGFVENELIQIIEGKDKRLIAGKDFGIGVCPETANPGEISKDFAKLPRLVGAIDEKTKNIIMEIYHHVFPVDIIPLPDCKTANAVKLTTNVFRDINIAFINELALLFEKLGIDTMIVLEAAKSKYNFQVHYPGAGVGGPCLPVNSYQLLNSAKKFGDDFLKIISAGREINEHMPNHVIELLCQVFDQAKKSIKDSVILCLGVSYKPDIKDIQLSPAEQIINKLKKLGADVRIYDPYFKNTKVFNIKTESNLVDALKGSDGIILVTAHKEFHDLEPSFLVSNMKTPIMVDTRGIIQPHDAKKVGLIFRGLGRGSD